MKKNILLLCGGGHTEHEISLISANYIESSLNPNKNYQICSVEIGQDRKWRRRSDNQEVQISSSGEIDGLKVDYCIPCIHGYPGETGHIPSLLELYGIPFLGSSAGASLICFNKVSTKLWLNALQIPNTPFIFLSSVQQQSQQHREALDFFKQWKRIYVKASNQGSSIGCYPVSQEADLLPAIAKAFEYSSYVLLEKEVVGRELEVSVYEYKGRIHASLPGEIICAGPDKFYSYEEKYSAKSHTSTLVVAPDLSEAVTKLIQDYSTMAFRGLQLRHLSRIDFFLSNDHDIYLNEINTFPGLTPISMFPKMMEQNGPSFVEFMTDCLCSDK